MARAVADPRRNRTRGSGWLLLMLGASLLRALGILCLPGVCGRALDLLLTPGTDATGQRAWVGASIGLLIAVPLCEAVTTTAAGALVAANTARGRRRLVDHILAVGPRLLGSAGVGDLVARAVGNAAQAATVSSRIAVVGISALPVLGAIALMFAIDVACATVFSAGLAILVLLSRSLLRSTREVSTQYLHTQGRIATAVTETLAGARTVAASGTAEAERARILADLPELHRQGAALWRLQAGTATRGAVLLPVLQILVLGIAGCRLSEGQLTVGQLFAISGYVALGARLITTFGQLSALGAARGAAARCSALLEVPATSYGPAPDNGGPGTIRLAEVTVDRPETAPLHRIDVEIPAGQSVALVGRDGSAATLAALCGRLVDPDAGTVLLDGQDVRTLTAQALHRSVTYAFDRPALVGATIAETLALRVEPVSTALLVEAAQAACADEFIRRLPAGYSTTLNDAPMSGGELQRLGLARAFAHPGRVLVLDDATSSLDTVTEHRISVALAAASGRTRLVVARRASTAARVDRVLWLDSGRVRGDGTHRDLWTNPDYQAVFRHDEPVSLGGTRVPGVEDRAAVFAL